MHSNSPETTHIPIEEVEELKATISKLEKENEEWYLRLDWVIHDRNELIFNLKQREKQLGQSEETIEDEGKERKRVGEFLSGVGLDLIQQNQELR